MTLIDDKHPAFIMHPLIHTPMDLAVFLLGILLCIVIGALLFIVAGFVLFAIVGAVKGFFKASPKPEARK